MIHTHRFGVDTYPFIGGYDLEIDQVARRLQVDYEADREEYLNISEEMDFPDIPNVDRLDDPEPAEEDHL